MSVGKVARIGALWKQGWIEIPEVMGSSLMAVMGIVVTFSIYYHTKWNYGFSQKYLKNYTVMRSDDPRIARIQKYSVLDK